MVLCSNLIPTINLMSNLIQMSKGMLSCCLNAFSFANIHENSTQLPFYSPVSLHFSRIREAPVHLALLMRLTGHLISNLVVSAA